MRSLLKIIGNSALVVSGFFLVLFATSKYSKHGGITLQHELNSGVAHAETADSASSGDSGGSGDCGSSDSGGGGK